MESSRLSQLLIVAGALLFALGLVFPLSVVTQTEKIVVFDNELLILPSGQEQLIIDRYFNISEGYTSVKANITVASYDIYFPIHYKVNDVLFGAMGVADNFVMSHTYDITEHVKSGSNKFTVKVWRYDYILRTQGLVEVPFRLTVVIEVSYAFEPSVEVPQGTDSKVVTEPELPEQPVTPEEGTVVTEKPPTFKVSMFQVMGLALIAVGAVMYLKRW